MGRARWRGGADPGRRRKGEVDVGPSVECSHVLGLLVQRSGLLALITSSDQLSNYLNALAAL